MLCIVSSEKQGIKRLWLILKQYPEMFLEEVRGIAINLFHNSRHLTVAIIIIIVRIINRGLPIRLRELILRDAKYKFTLSAFAKSEVNMLEVPST
jgi:hypothetical protein